MDASWAWNDRAGVGIDGGSHSSRVERLFGEPTVVARERGCEDGQTGICPSLFGLAAVRQPPVPEPVFGQRVPSRSGRGTARHTGLGVYSGEWDCGRWSGEGQIAMDNGVAIEGRFERGAAHGVCVLVAPGGTVYRGAFRNGLPVGRFALTFRDAVRFEGEWRTEFEAAGRAVFVDGRSTPAVLRDGRLRAAERLRSS